VHLGQEVRHLFAELLGKRGASNSFEVDRVEFGNDVESDELANDFNRVIGRDDVRVIEKLAEKGNEELGEAGEANDIVFVELVLVIDGVFDHLKSLDLVVSDQQVKSQTADKLTGKNILLNSLNRTNR
jgi:hypothetical protein